MHKYRPEIDGLRALAVAGVLLFHGNIGVSGGFIGVDIFFVISGFLITGIIVREVEGGRFQFMNFWKRRVLRLLPALTVLITITLALGYFILLPRDFKELGQSVVAHSCLSSNVFFWLKSGYFAAASETKPLLHLWSLSVEEQFYVVFPLLLFSVLRLGRKATVTLLAGLWIASFALSYYQTVESPDLAFFLVFGRSWELLTGALVCFLPKPSRRSIAEVVGWTALAACLYPMYAYDWYTLVPAPAAVIPCFGAAALIWANGNEATSAGRLLSLKPIVFIGLISYSLYLWHWPIIVFTHYQSAVPLRFTTKALLLVASVAAGTLSWRFVEQPFRVLNTVPPRRVLRWGAAVLVLLGVAGLGLHISKGFPNRFSDQANTFLLVDAGEFEAAEGVEVNVRETKTLPQFTESQTGEHFDFLLWGDSHAHGLSRLFNRLAKEHDLAGVAATDPGSPPLMNAWWPRHERMVEFNDKVMKFVQSNRIDTVFLAARWSRYAMGDGAQGLLVDSNHRSMNLDDSKALFRSSMAETLQQLKQAGVRVVLLRQAPDQGFDVPRALALNANNPEVRNELRRTRATHDGYQSFVNSGFDEHASDIDVVDPDEVLFDASDRSRVEHNGSPLYIDGNHLSIRGSFALWPLLEPYMQEIAERNARDRKAVD